jgi:hypothetical protein
MSSQYAMSAMSVVEFLLWATLGFLFWKKALMRRFPAMGAYLALHVLATPFLIGVLYIQSQPWGREYLQAYFYAYWAVYAASAVLLFFICIEVFRSALSAFPGLMKIGIVIFRWAMVVSIIMSLGSVLVTHGHFQGAVTAEITVSLMRWVSILALCLLAFLCLCMNALRLPVRDMAFGIALGFGVLSADDFVMASFFSAHSTLTGDLQIAYEAVVLASLLVWIGYAALPERVRKPIMMPASSAIYRWNEIASALGHTGTQVAVQQPANGFFLTDVEKVVEKVLSRNLKERESKT